MTSSFTALRPKKYHEVTRTSGREVARAPWTAYPALHRQTNASFARDEVTAGQFVLLAALADIDAVTQQELVRRSSSDPNTVREPLPARLLVSLRPDEILTLF